MTEPAAADAPATDLPAAPTEPDAPAPAPDPEPTPEPAPDAAQYDDTVPVAPLAEPFSPAVIVCGDVEPSEWAATFDAGSVELLVGLNPEDITTVAVDSGSGAVEVDSWSVSPLEGVTGVAQLAVRHAKLTGDATLIIG